MEKKPIKISIQDVKNYLNNTSEEEMRKDFSHLDMKKFFKSPKKNFFQKIISKTQNF